MWTFTEYCDYDDYDYDFGEEGKRKDTRTKERHPAGQLLFRSYRITLDYRIHYKFDGWPGRHRLGWAHPLGMINQVKGKATHFHRRSVDWARSVSSSITIIEQPNVNYEIAPRCDWTSGKQIILQLKAISKNASELNENRKSTCSLLSHQLNWNHGVLLHLYLYLWQVCLEICLL